jgi:hypothetical protein
MDELEKLAEVVRRYDSDGNYEAAHPAEDHLLVRALELIRDGAVDPVQAATLALSTQSDDSVRWYA